MGRRDAPLDTSRIHLERRIRRFAKGTKPGMLVLDAGAGKGPYQRFFKHARYESADFAALEGRKYDGLTYRCDLTAIPVEDARFDRVFSSQVLEHLPDPAAVVAEFARVLKPGGRVLVTCPLLFHEHQVPYDYYRYTQYGLRHLFEQAGLEVRSVEWLEGYFGTVGYQYAAMRRWLPRDAKGLGLGWRRLYVGPLLRFERWHAELGRVAFGRLDLRARYVDGGSPKNYVLVAVKPGAGSGT